LVGRQPILNRERYVVAYELLYRSSTGQTEACVKDDAAATTCVVTRAFRDIGIGTVAGGCAAFVNVDAEWLLSPKTETLPTSHVVLELLETVDLDDRVVRRCQALKARGFRLALDDVSSYSETYEPLREIVDVVKIDVSRLDLGSLTKLAERLRSWPAKLLAEKIDTVPRLRQCLGLGFELFQGFLCGRPVVLGA
jgi:EAL and modified HD-GYP domain-containing signal transduction protein